MDFSRIWRKIEAEKTSQKRVWRILISTKDYILWPLSEIIKNITLLPIGIYDILNYFIIEKPLISFLEYRSLINSDNFPEFGGGIFNPGAVDFNSNILLLARGEKYSHAKFLKKDDYYNNSSSPLIFAFNDRCNIKKINIKYFPEYSHRFEDFRLFKFKDRIYSNFCIMKWDPQIFFLNRNLNLKETKMMLGELDINKNELKDINFIKTDFELNNTEKNWVFFEKENSLYFIYSFSPFYRVLKLSVKQDKYNFQTIILKENKLPFNKYRKKKISLSTNPVEYDENYYIMLIHSKNNWNVSYKFWAVLISKQTLLIEKITFRPLIKSCHILQKSLNQIVYASSIVKNYDDYICFMGKADKESLYVSINKKTLDASWINFN